MAAPVQAQTSATNPVQQINANFFASSRISYRPFLLAAPFVMARPGLPRLPRPGDAYISRPPPLQRVERFVILTTMTTAVQAWVALLAGFATALLGILKYFNYRNRRDR